MYRTVGFARKSAEDKKFHRFEFRRNEPGPDDVEFEIKFCGVCHTDVHIAEDDFGGNTNYPCVPGHELAGIVTKVRIMKSDRDAAVSVQDALAFFSAFAVHSDDDDFGDYDDNDDDDVDGDDDDDDDGDNDDDNDDDDNDDGDADADDNADDVILPFKVGKNVIKVKLGDRVGVGCISDSCLACDSCKEGEEQYCERGHTMTYDTKIVHGHLKTDTGYTFGGYSQRMTVMQDFIIKVV